jgi:hypothetical protein
MKSAMADAEIKPHASEVAKVLQSYMKNLPRDFSAVERAAVSSTPMKSAGALGETPSEQFEMEALMSGKRLLEEELGCPVSVEREECSSAPKANAALPGKPASLSNLFATSTCSCPSHKSSLPSGFLPRLR